MTITMYSLLSSFSISFFFITLPDVNTQSMATTATNIRLSLRTVAGVKDLDFFEVDQQDSADLSALDVSNRGTPVVNAC